MVEILSAKEITRINVEHLKKQYNYIPKTIEINNLYKIIVRERNMYMQLMDEFKTERAFNGLLSNNDEKCHFLLEYDFLFNYMDNFTTLDEISYDKAIINGFKKWREQLKNRSE